jgi:hypothetical protein
VCCQPRQHSNARIRSCQACTPTCLVYVTGVAANMQLPQTFEVHKSSSSHTGRKFFQSRFTSDTSEQDCALRAVRWRACASRWQNKRSATAPLDVSAQIRQQSLPASDDGLHIGKCSQGPRMCYLLACTGRKTQPAALC